MSTPSIIYDGNLAVATQDGPGWSTRPFQDRNDTQSFEFHAYFTQLAANYVPFVNPRNTLIAFGSTSPTIAYVENMTAYTTPLGTAYLVHEDEPSEVNNTGLLRFRRTFASMPGTRYEACEVAHSFQILSTTAGLGEAGTNEVQEFQFTLQGYRKYEYFRETVPSIIQAPAVFVMFGAAYKKGGYPVANTPGTSYVSKDSVISIYKGQFYERMTLYYIAPSLTPALP